MVDPQFAFAHATRGLSRFPPNVELISVERETLVTWLVVRRNDVVPRFPLRDEDCRHLAGCLLGPAATPPAGRQR
jgi:hypothetical protein